MSAQIPLPSFDDIRKLLNFWFDQQDKWFYFETETIQAGSTESRKDPQDIPFDHLNVLYKITTTRESIHYIQTRLVGHIYNVIPYPPSLLLRDTTIFKVALNYRDNCEENIDLISIEKRKSFGLVFSQITYYEPIKNVKEFLVNDKRVVIEKKE